MSPPERIGRRGLGERGSEPPGVSGSRLYKSEFTIQGTVALVTGANRGIGRALTEALLERGAAKVYAAARRPEELAELAGRHGDRLVPVALDVTDGEQVRAAAAAASDARILFNNAGVAVGGGLTDEGIVDAARRERPQRL